MTEILIFLNSLTIIFLEKEQTTQAIITALKDGELQSFQPLEPLFSKIPPR